ncbi:endo-exonuclease [Desarmillaria tabescens]|uniref:Endo-exonuclease n=1 Tax=Armillaria tabescens TaxID=1929756 RepID=A0AA39MMT6_ARMTA|nr:endo-exonuclease [Desarmillaria tabescens]KAK0439504.1 endo-exonuclease [Desarmillaria tabescens]
MLSKLFLILNFHLLAVYALPMDHSTNSNGSWPESVKRATPILQIDYLTYPREHLRIFFSVARSKITNVFFTTTGQVTPGIVIMDLVSWRRTETLQATIAGQIAAVVPVQTANGHIAGYQCDEWPWANSHAGGANAVTRCIPGADNGGSGSVWGNFINVGFHSIYVVPDTIYSDEQQNKGPQAPGYRLNDLVDSAEIRVVRIPNNAYFCMGELGYQITNAMCAQGDHGQPYLQRIG